MNPTDRGQPQEWVTGQSAARQARAHVASQLTEHVIAGDLTGSRSLTARRVRNLAEAERSGDQMVIRASLMDLAAAAAAYACQIDLATPTLGGNGRVLSLDSARVRR